MGLEESASVGISIETQSEDQVIGHHLATRDCGHSREVGTMW